MKYSRLILAATLAMAASGAAAQNTATGLLNDGYLYRHEMNPAIQNDQKYISFPILGNINTTLRGNVGLKDFIYSRNGETVLFMHPSVSAEEATKAFSDKMRLDEEFKMSILSMGFKTGKRGYTTIGLNLRESASLQLPGELFKLAKLGPENKSYDLSAMNMHADAFGELAIGHSQRIGKNLVIGAKAKVLLGFAAVDAYAKECRLTLGEDRWTATTEATVEASVKGLNYISETEMRGPEGQETPHTYISDLDYDSPGLNGMGFGVDLGFTYNIGWGLNVGASIVDLGVINWNNNLLASTDGAHTMSTDEFVFSVDDDDEDSFENEGERLGNALNDLYELKDMGDQGSRSRSLKPTFNAFVEYKLPAYDKLSFGLMNTTRFAGDNTWTEFRLSANIAPTKWLSASISGAEGTFGPAMGWMLNIHPKGFNLYAGMDYLFTEVNPQFIPLSKKCNFNVGINFPF